MNSVVAARSNCKLRIILFTFTDLTLLGLLRLVKVMKLNKAQLNRIASKVLQSVEDCESCTVKEKPEKIQARIVEYLISDMNREAELDKAVLKMMDDLESQGQGEFERYKMFPLLKKRLAKERGIVL